MTEIRSLTGRMVRAAKLDVTLYEEVGADAKASWQALAVVIIVSLAAGLGIAINGLISSDEGFLSLLWVLGICLVVWLLWALVVYLIGITIFRTKKTQVSYGQLLRTLGFASTPFILWFFFFIPIVNVILSILGSLWMLVAGVIAVRQALNFSTWRSIGTCITGLIPFAALFYLLLRLTAYVDSLL